MKTQTTLATVEDAWSCFKIEALVHIRNYAQAYDRGDESNAEGPCIVVDETLATFVRTHPGELERRLLSAIDQMAVARPADGSDERSELALLVRYGMAFHELLRATFAAIDPVVGLRICNRALWHHQQPAESNWEDVCTNAAGQFVHQIDRARVAELDLTPEMRHALGPMPLPDVLPSDLSSCTPGDIERLLEDYTGAPIEALERRLRPGASSSVGFLAAHDRLGQIICEDAKMLGSLGVSRHALADRIERAINRYPILDIDGRELALKVTERGSLGVQYDPFHTAPVHVNSRSFTITNLSLPNAPTIGGGWLAMPFIRRLCFFEGHVPYRIEPRVAAYVLGLAR